MDKNYLVTKSNYFIMNSSYDLSLEEQKIILTLASMVQPTDKEFKPYIFKIADFMELLGVENQAKYTQIPKMTKELMKKVFEIRQGNKITQVAWLSSAEYEKGTGMVELEFSPKLKPYMLQLKEKFTQYQLANVLTMKSKYSPRVYEILKCNEFKKQGHIEIEVQELRKLLKAENIYPLYNDFKRKIIIQTQKELKKLSDINFDFEEIKTGRKVTALKFYIKSNNKVKNEIAVGAVKKEDPQNDIDDTNNIKQVQALFYNHEINQREAKSVLKDSNNNIDLIKKCYDYALRKNVDNIVAYVKKLVKGFNEPQGNAPKNTFNDYEQRNYNFNKLERKLLGWDEYDETERLDQQ